ncbi:hypothetical protein LZD49_04970 [Dyadobacter sp. CY261]|uniref:hypothetical protein n=1 Tax=Dyadobacter sp. CY261 TaxID=2907203 RepID=UPI001F2A90EE|nr:hypothetical protein [Dyadobacter sp. CY261]MCF0069812.1 hypothetical protein [Dyadobacter sp. CY261]
MKTILGYLTFAILFALCYVERNQADEAKNQARRHTAKRGGVGRGPGWVSQSKTAARLRQ